MIELKKVSGKIVNGPKPETDEMDDGVCLLGVRINVEGKKIALNVMSNASVMKTFYKSGLFNDMKRMLHEAVETTCNDSLHYLEREGKA